MVIASHPVVPKTMSNGCFPITFYFSDGLFSFRNHWQYEWFLMTCCSFSFICKASAINIFNILYFMWVSYIIIIKFLSQIFLMFYPQNLIQFMTEMTSLFHLLPCYLFAQNSLKHAVEGYLISLLLVTSPSLWAGLDFSDKNPGFPSFSWSLDLVYVR